MFLHDCLCIACIAVHCIDIDFLVVAVDPLPRHSRTSFLATVDTTPHHSPSSADPEVRFTSTSTSTSTYTSVVVVMMFLLRIVSFQHWLTVPCGALHQHRPPSPSTSPLPSASSSTSSSTSLPLSTSSTSLSPSASSSP